MVGKVIVAIFALVMLFLFFGPVQTSVTDFRSDEFTETEVGLTNGAVATGNFTLDQDLYNDSINSVVSITSNITEAGAVTPTGYTASTRNLQVTGLKASETRTFAVVYSVSALEDNIGLREFAPFFLFFFVLGGVGLVLRFFLKRR